MRLSIFIVSAAPTVARASRSAFTFAATLLPLLLLLELPAPSSAADFTYSTDNVQITITGYLGLGGAVSIPGAIDGLPVTRIGDRAFSASSLTVVTIPNSVSSIGNEAFSSCATLSIVTIPNSVSKIGNEAFAGCTNLTSITIPDSVVTIGDRAFLGCRTLQTITVELHNSFYRSVDGVLFNTSQTRLIQYPGGKVGSYTVPNSVTTIANYAFAVCANLPSVTIPDGVTTIGDSTFYGCTSLNTITVGSGATTIEDYAFYLCTSLEGVYFKGNAASLGSFVFTPGASAIVYYLAGTTGWDATYGGRPTLLWDPDVPYIYTTNNGEITITGYAHPGGVITIPSTIDGLPVTSIADRAFQSRASLTSVIIPNGVTSIGEGAFNRCSSLSAITVEELNSFYRSVDGVLFNQSQTTLIQYPGGKAGSYIIPDSVTTIESSALAGCASLASVTIPNSVASIGSATFAGCASLANVTIPNTVISIEANLLRGCTSLTNVSIPKSVTTVGDGAFTACASLIRVAIPSSVISIGNSAFAGCANLRGLYFQGNYPSIGSFVLRGANKVIVYYLPGTTGWSVLFDGREPVVWNDQAVMTDPEFSVLSDQFGFTVTGIPDSLIVIEATSSLTNPRWSALSTNRLTAGSAHFIDPRGINRDAGFYRLRPPPVR
jgi:hypothetical protein